MLLKYRIRLYKRIDLMPKKVFEFVKAKKVSPNYEWDLKSSLNFELKYFRKPYINMA